MKEYIHNLGSLFDEVSSTEPKRVAITFSSEENYTFGQLNIDSNRMANLLLHKGLNKNDVCAIAGVKKYYTYVSFVACLKIGVTYTFFDPESPWERLSRIFQKAQPKLVIGYLSEMLERVDQSYDQFNFEGIQNQKEFMLGFNLNFEFDQIEGSTPAYIMFTSGSTGFPKGAAMSHANILNFISWGRQTYSITKNDIHTNVNPLYFDNSVFDLYCSLFNGAQLVPITKSDALNPKRLLDSLYDNKCTTWFSVPSLLIYLISSKAIIPEKWKFV